MPLFFQHSINDSTSLGIWKIEEPDGFFLERVPVKQQVTHPYKRLQHLAGRYLLAELFSDFPIEEIRIADTRKPFLEGERYHFSISHCGNFAAAIASRQKRVGIDIELITPTVSRVAEKFLNGHELRLVSEWQHLPRLHLQLLTILWSAKEAVYKWHGDGGVDFRKHMRMAGSRIAVNPDESIDLPFIFSKKEEIPLKVDVRIFGDLVLTWVVT